MLTVTQAFCESRAAQLRFQVQTGYMYMKLVSRKVNNKGVLLVLFFCCLL